MNRYLIGVLVLGIVAMATWAYNVNYDTKTVIKRVDALRSQIAAERERGQVLRVEWAYLNAPDRLRRLVARYNDRLRLVPLATGQFREAAAIPYPKDAESPEAPLVATGPLGTVPVPPARPANFSTGGRQ